MFGLLPHRCLLRCEDAGTSYRIGDRSGFDSIRLLMASFVRRYHLHFLCFISLLFSLFVYFLLSLLLFLFLFLLLLLAEGGVKVGRDMHSNSSATQCQRQRQQQRQRQRSHRHLRQRHINAQRATRRANFNFSCSSISISNSNFNCHCDCDLDLKSDFHLNRRPSQILDRVAAGAANARFCLKSQNGIRLQVKHIFVTPMCMLHVAGPRAEPSSPRAMAINKLTLMRCANTTANWSNSFRIILLRSNSDREITRRQQVNETYRELKQIEGSMGETVCTSMVDTIALQALDVFKTRQDEA